MTPRLLLALLALLSALVLAACGDDDDGEEPGNAEAAATAAIGGRYFSDLSPWNTPVAGLPKAADSKQMLRLARKRVAVVEQSGEAGVTTVERDVEDGFHINTDSWAPLIVRAGGDGALPTKMVCRQRDCGPEPERVPATLPLPPGTDPDPRYDGWLSVIDPARGIGYDFWRARRQSDDTISYQYAKAWALDGPGFSRPISVDPVRAAGARGSGLPLFAGVIGPEELRTGEIDHALAVSVPGLARHRYVQPASVTDGVGPTEALPAGARIRLKGSVLPETRLDGPTRSSVEAILVALRTYGAIVVDRAAVPTLYAARGTPSSLVREGELDWLRLSDFEVVALPKVYRDPPLEKTRLLGAGLPPRPAGGAG